MAGPVALAQTPQELSGIRSKLYLDAADEIARIGVQGVSINLGCIGLLRDTLEREVGKSLREFTERDQRAIALLKSATEETYELKIRGPAHLFDFLRAELKKFKDLCTASKDDRLRAERLCRRIAAKLVNGHAGTWI